ncbi:MAG: 2-methylcitrate dehydratase [Ramlibacter sp.]|jgi:2-methylcitrate dehydratase PrpD|nr:2-methylcitrate dehydratase [Ramlibacter sp.]
MAASNFGLDDHIAGRLARFAVELRTADIPQAVWTKSVHHIVDGIGLAFASHHFPYAAPALNGISAIGGGGEATVIGSKLRLSPRDAALANAYLLHGLDFDDTHPASIVHPTVASFPAALAVAETQNATWGELIAAYVAGMETCIRLGQSVSGGFHHAGFHATGLLSHFSSAVVAGRLFGLSPEQIVGAQGIAASTSAGVQVFLENGAWTKRLHPGWGAMSGITAAQLMRHGFLAPQRAYEGRFGFFETHVQQHLADVDFESITAGLGERYAMLDTAIKPYPVCHFIHGAAEAALQLHAELGQTPDIERVTCELPAATLPIVAEPAAAKAVPRSDYEGKFSAQYVVATCLLRGRFGLAELDADSLSDPRTLALTPRITCVLEENTAFPKHFSGAVTVQLRSGTTYTRRIPVNLGSGERALSRDDIIAKFQGTAGVVLPASRVGRLLDALLSAQRDTPVRKIAELLKG